MSSFISSSGLTYLWTKIKAWVNGQGFLTQHQDISGKADKATTLAGYGITDAASSSDLDDYLPLTGGTLTGALTVNDDVTTTGTLYTDNGKFVQAKDTGSTYRNILGISSSNNFVVGYGMPAAGISTFIYGSGSVRLRVGGTAEEYDGLFIDSSLHSRFGGRIYLKNNVPIYYKDSNDTDHTVMYLSSSNELQIGNGTATLGGTVIHGTSIVFKTNGTAGGNAALTLDSSKDASFSGSVSVSGNESVTGYIKASGDIYMAPATATTNTDSKKLYFRTSHINDSTNNLGPYIQGITNSTTYGRKRLSVFQVDAASYTDTYEEVFTILPNGRVGIGTVTPSALLEVAGNAAITGTLTLGGNPVAVVYSGSSAPSSSTGSNGDIYIQTS